MKCRGSGAREIATSSFSWTSLLRESRQAQELLGTRASWGRCKSSDRSAAVQQSRWRRPLSTSSWTPFELLPPGAAAAWHHGSRHPTFRLCLELKCSFGGYTVTIVGCNNDSQHIVSTCLGPYSTSTFAEAVLCNCHVGVYLQRQTLSDGRLRPLSQQGMTWCMIVCHLI